MIIVLMGVSGSGKSTVAQELSMLLRIDMIEGDNLHSAENLEKMSSGIALTEEDRLPWLQSIRSRIDSATENGEHLIVTCSALTEQSRNILGTDRQNITLVHLNGSRELIKERLSKRSDHFMPPKLLNSQFKTLEAPEKDKAIKVSINASPENIAHNIAAQLIKLS